MKKFLIITIIVAIAGFAIYFGLNTNSRSLAPREEEIVTDIEEQLAPVEPDKAFLEPIIFSSLNQKYDHTNFTFNYPVGFKVLRSDLGDGDGEPVNGGLTSIGGEVITIESEKGSGFQIFVTVFDETGPITPERIWQDEPEMDIIDPKNADLDGSKALVFYGYDGDLGETFEVWTVRKGKLYQISGPKVAEQLIIETLETWKWSR